MKGRYLPSLDLGWLNLRKRCYLANLQAKFRLIPSTEFAEFRQRTSDCPNEVPGASALVCRYMLKRFCRCRTLSDCLAPHAARSCSIRAGSEANASTAKRGTKFCARASQRVQTGSSPTASFAMKRSATCSVRTSAVSRF